MSELRDEPSRQTRRTMVHNLGLELLRVGTWGCTGRIGATCKLNNRKLSSSGWNNPHRRRIPWFASVLDFTSHQPVKNNQLRLFCFYNPDGLESYYSRPISCRLRPHASFSLHGLGLLSFPLVQMILAVLAPQCCLRFDSLSVLSA